MAYTEIDDPSAYFQAKLHTGTGSEQAVSGIGFAPNWVWIKSRSDAHDHFIHDTVRGATKNLNSLNTDAEATIAEGLKSFDSDGFTMGTNGNINEDDETFVSWNWLAGTSFTNDASSTSVGSVDTAGSVNTTAGFSIMKYTGVSGQQTIAHGLGAVPRMIIVKNLDSTETWRVYHHYNTAAKYMKLNTTGAVVSDTGSFSNVTPTSSVITMGGDDGTMHANEEMIAYIFAEKKGYSKFGSYKGNGNADGTFVYTGFKPAFMIRKRSDGVVDWRMDDNKRRSFNAIDFTLFPNKNNAETQSAGYAVDLLSNGFKVRGDSGNQNTNNGTYIYMAFAEQPLVTSTGVPATTR